MAEVFEPGEEVPKIRDL